MPAASSNKFKKSFAFLSKTLSSGISAGDTSAPLSDVNNVPTDTAVDFIVDRVDSNGVQTPAKREIMTGIVSGSSVISLLRGRQGTTAQSHNTSTIVEFNVSAQTHNDMVDGILTQHTQTGTHQAITNTGGLTTDSLTVSGASILSGALTVDGAISGTGFSAGTLTNPYKFSVWMNAAANTGNSAFAVIPWDTELFDTNNNVSAGVWTVPVSGFYQISWGISILTVGAELFIVSLHINGVRTRDGNVSKATSADTSSIGSSLFQLTAGDVVDIRAFNSSTRALSTGNIFQNYFTGILMCRT